MLGCYKEAFHTASDGISSNSLFITRLAYSCAIALRWQNVSSATKAGIYRQVVVEENRVKQILRIAKTL